MFGRRKELAPLGEPRRALDAADVQIFLEESEVRTSGKTPTLYDLIAICRELRRIDPVRASVIEHDLKWLMKASDRHLKAGWEHPWRKR